MGRSSTVKKRRQNIKDAIQGEIASSNGSGSGTLRQIKAQTTKAAWDGNKSMLFLDDRSPLQINVDEEGDFSVADAGPMTSRARPKIEVDVISQNIEKYRSSYK